MRKTLYVCIVIATMCTMTIGNTDDPIWVKEDLVAYTKVCSRAMLCAWMVGCCIGMYRDHGANKESIAVTQALSKLRQISTMSLYKLIH